MQRRLTSFFKPTDSDAGTSRDNPSATEVLPRNEQTLDVRLISEETNLREPQTEEMASRTISTDLSVNPYDNPCQPVLTDYPATTIGNRKRKFNSSYFLKYPWLEYSKEQDSVFCFNCRHFSGSSLRSGERYGARAFIDIGFRKWKDISELIRQHENSDRHKACTISLTQFKAIETEAAESVASCLSKEREKEILENRQYVKALLKTTALLGRQGLAFRGHDEGESSANQGNFVETVHLLTEINPDLMKNSRKAYGHYMSHEYQNDYIEVIGNEIKSSIAKEVREAKYFAVLVDETKDLSKKEQLAILVRYVHDLKIKERAIGCYHMRKVDAESLADFIYNEIKGIGLDWSKCVGQCYDGASVMSGHFSGVQARLREKAPQAVYTHCHSHRLNLVIGDCMQKIQRISSVFSVLQTVYSFVSNSNTRYQLFVEAQKTANVPVLTLERTVVTRWSYWYRSVAKILVRYDCILAVLSVVQESSDREAAAEATGLKNQLESFPFIFSLHVIHEVLAVINPLSEQLQAADLVISEACTLISATKNELRKMRDDEYFRVLYGKSKEMAINVGADLSETSALSSAIPVKSKRVQKISGRLRDYLTTTTIGKHNIDSESTTTEDKMRREFYEVLDRVLNEFEERFSVQLPVLEATRCLNPKSTDFMDSDLLFVIATYFDQAGIDTMQLKCQALIARAFVSQLLQKPANALDVFEQLGGLKEAYSELLKVVRVVLTLPLTTCSNERFFSVLTFVKDYLRTTMENERLSHLLLIFSEKAAVKELNFEKLVDDFAKMKQRRYPLLK
ncbi:zinc finger MYM-type protein 1-like [Artemia franciscana]|uniref:zinc finger MYM-type protein 1-like n=1 Tax=Artemia franciscana TaxID=6661 RepID=UPI0032D9D67C